MIMCCEKCYAEIQKKSNDCATLWMRLCEAFIQCRGIFGIFEQNAPQLVPLMRTLESMGFVVTADSCQCVKMRVEGYNYIPETDTELFCINRRFHHAT